MFFRLEIATRMERNGAIASVRNAIVECGGWITGHQLFSNIAASISCEIPLCCAGKLISCLRDAELQPDYQGDIPKGSDGDLRMGISLTFIHTEPDLKREVPAFG
jgi:hypothetical protein